ncbi:MAG: PEP-CTERM-box response regulator transcription factor [Rhodospirillales bacterium]|nr:PEP-CTERM-box response regulator transcription factor [Rhodospirillales bacterium]
MSSGGAQKLLIVDDDEALRRQLRWALDGYEVLLAGDRPSAVAAVRHQHPPVALLDLGLPPDPDGASEGLAALDEILAAAPSTKVIVLSGQAQRDHAVRAVAQGAYDFYEKPIELHALDLILRRACHLHALESEHLRLTAADPPPALPGLITVSDAMLKVCAEVRRFAPSDVSILLLGESGTGKEVVAQAVHALSHRAGGPFIAINCAAIPEHLLESELFGHEKGAFTGATRTTPGKVELADGGTLFLDEIGDLPLPLQAKLFRFLQERVIERVGGRTPIRVDLRVVSATNKHVLPEIAHGTFREELYYRLSGVVLQMPALRERPEDALAIGRHFLKTMARDEGRPVRNFAADAVAAIIRYGWPGNVRELENRIRRAVVGATGPLVTAADMDLAADRFCQTTISLREAREKAERMAVSRAMLAADNNVSKAARLLDISRPTLYQLLRDHGMR